MNFEDDREYIVIEDHTFLETTLLCVSIVAVFVGMAWLWTL